MTIDIDKLRAAHAACLPGKWEPLMTCGRMHICAPTSNNDVATMAIAQEPVASFIAIAHNEFPTMLDEIERLRQINYQWDSVFGHLGETPDECGNAIRAEFDKRDAEIQKLRALLSQATEVFSDTCDCGECGACNLREEMVAALGSGADGYEQSKHDKRLAVEIALINLLCVINDDKDGGFFICAEAADRIRDAQGILGVTK